MSQCGDGWCAIPVTMSPHDGAIVLGMLNSLARPTHRAPVLLAVRDVRAEVLAGFGQTALMVRTLDGVSLELHAGELVVLQGGVASGAVALLNALAGTRHILSGTRVEAHGVRVRRGSISDEAFRALAAAWTEHEVTDGSYAVYETRPAVYLFRVRRGGPDAETSAGWRRNPPATDLGVWRTWAASLRAHGGCVLAYCPTTREASRGHAVHEMANGVNEYAPRYTGVRLLTLAAGRIVRSDLSPVGLQRPSPTVAPRDRPTPYIPFSPHNVAPDPGP